VKQRLANYRKIGSAPPVWSVFLPPPPPPPEFEHKKGLSRRTHWRLNKKAKCLIASAAIAVVLISCFALLYKPSGSKGDVVTVPTGRTSATPSTTPQTSASPTPNIAGVIPSPTPNTQEAVYKHKPIGLIESAKIINSTIWREVAANAWAYFQPGVGVDNITGLPYASTGGLFKAFTDWDLGSYIEAIVDAQQIGLINSTGAWGSDARLDKVFTFLETRPLNTTTEWPFWFYNSTDGQGFMTNTTYASDGLDITDTGALFVALNNLITYNASWKQPVDNFVYNVYNNRSNYADLVTGLQAYVNSNSIYGYLIVSGFACFWPQQLDNIPNQIMINIDNSPTITTFNVTLPDVPITCEPLLLSIFELKNNDTRLMNLMNQVYLAQEACYNATLHYVAYSEGSGEGSYIYEWVVGPNGTAWMITTSDGRAYSGNPIIYNKVAFSFLALYNSTYARNTVICLEETLPTPTKGYYDGASIRGIELSETTNIGNSMILDAALYALTK